MYNMHVQCVEIQIFHCIFVTDEILDVSISNSPGLLIHNLYV